MWDFLEALRADRENPIFKVAIFQRHRISRHHVAMMTHGGGFASPVARTERGYCRVRGPASTMVWCLFTIGCRDGKPRSILSAVSGGRGEKTREIPHHDPSFILYQQNRSSSLKPVPSKFLRRHLGLLGLLTAIESERHDEKSPFLCKILLITGTIARTIFGHGLDRTMGNNLDL